MDACNISPALLVLPLSFLFRLARSLLFFLSFRRLLASSLHRPSVRPSVRPSFLLPLRSFVRSFPRCPPALRPSCSCPIHASTAAATEAAARPSSVGRSVCLPLPSFFSPLPPSVSVRSALIPLLLPPLGVGRTRKAISSSRLPCTSWARSAATTSLRGGGVSPPPPPHRRPPVNSAASRLFRPRFPLPRRRLRRSLRPPAVPTLELGARHTDGGYVS